MFTKNPHINGEILLSPNNALIFKAGEYKGKAQRIAAANLDLFFLYVENLRAFGILNENSTLVENLGDNAVATLKDIFFDTLEEWQLSQQQSFNRLLAANHGILHANSEPIHPLINAPQKTNPSFVRLRSWLVSLLRSSAIGRRNANLNKETLIG